MRLSNAHVDIVEYADFNPHRKAGEMALAVAFEGRAPFAAVTNEGRQPQFRCYLFGPTGKQITDDEVGAVYFDAPAIAKTPTTERVEVTYEERYKYKAIVFPGLKARTNVNRPADINLLGNSYDYVQCQLVGVQMLGGFMYSNTISITNGEVRQRYEMRQRESSIK